MRSKVICYLFIFVCCYVVFNTRHIDKNFYEYDKSGYYTYLPAIFIYHDLERCDFHPAMAEKYHMGGGGKFGLNEIQNGKWLNKYAIGPAVFEMPAFLIAHAYCSITGAYDADGYSVPYEYALLLSTIIWSFIGLLVLRRFLLRHFNDTVTAVVIACIAFGTNFYNYAAFDQGMSHNFSFFLFSCLLLFTDRWYTAPNRKDMCLIGIVLGSIVITRPVNLIAILIPLFWGVYNKQTFLSRCKELTSGYKDVLLAFICFMLVALIQLSYWKYISGHWVYYSYVGEEFNFKDPHILKGLFSYRKGWFVYTPIALVGLLGLCFTPRKYISSIITFFCLMIYVVFSWENWYYGGGFSARALIETLPVVAFPLAFVTKTVVDKWKRVFRSLFFMLLAFLIVLNLFQTYQLRKGVLHYDRMTKDYYWAIFGKLRVDSENNKYLMPDQEYYDEIIEWNNN